MSRRIAHRLGPCRLSWGNYGQKLSEEIAAAYNTAWPAELLRVDIVAYAGWSGAYTSLYPTRVTIASEDEANQKLSALEVIFHESRTH
jgi:hypothetical protein